jgi:large subunit ribosomal protein L6
MSRIGKKAVFIPEGVTLKVDGNQVMVSGKLGNLDLTLPAILKIEVKDKEILVSCPSEEKKDQMLHGTFRQYLANMIKGVTEGWKKDLEVRGVGYRVNLEGENLIFNLGYSHPVKAVPPKGIKYEVKENVVSVFGLDKASVGLEADRIRRIAPPDMYKGKGIRYLGEVINLKPGKAVKAGAAAGAAAPGK